MPPTLAKQESLNHHLILVAADPVDEGELLAEITLMITDLQLGPQSVDFLIVLSDHIRNAVIVLGELLKS